MGSRPLQVTLVNWIECFTATWVQIPSKSRWIDWMLYSYVGSSVLSKWHGGLVECFKATWAQVPSKSPGRLVECFTAMWVQVPFKVYLGYGWMLYSYVGSSPLKVTLDWLNALQLCGFKYSPSHAGLVECFTATWVQIPSKSCWIGWMLYSYVGSSPLQVTLDWLNALQLCGFKSPPSHGGLVECFTARSVQVLLQVMVDWLNALQLCGFKSPPSHTGLVECFTAMWVQVMLDLLNALQLCGFKSGPNHTGLVECFTATWVQVPSKSRWIGWMLYSYMGSSHAGFVECFTAMWVQVPSKSRWIGWRLYSYVGSSALQAMVDWLNALQLRGFKSPSSHAGFVECFTAMWVQVPSKSQVDWLNSLELCGFKTPPHHAELVECFTATWVQVPSKSHWIGWMLYRYMASSPLQVMLDWLNTLKLCWFNTPPGHAGLVECFTAMWFKVLSKTCWIGWNFYRYVV